MKSSVYTELFFCCILNPSMIVNPNPRIVQLLTALLTLLNFYFVLIAPVLDVDAALYAALSMEMIENQSYFHLYERGIDYLDKPPLLFWLNALSFKIFGIHPWSYRLPSLLSLIPALFTLYHFVKSISDAEKAQLSVMVFSSSIGFWWIASDLKTDLMLVSFIICAAYFLTQALSKPSFLHHLAYAFFTALAMMSKGLPGLFLPLVMLIPYIIARGMFRELMRIPWWWILPLIALFIFPMLFGLYTQFDQHPEKWVHGKQGVSGLKFFFWEQSFGRITGENKWSNNAPWHYLFSHAFLLLFPYSLLFPILLKPKTMQGIGGWYFFLGAMFVLLVLSTSHYKIPHYTAVAFPFLSIFLAGVVSKLKSVLWPLLAILILLSVSALLAWSTAYSPLSVSIMCAVGVSAFLLFRSPTLLIKFTALFSGLLLNAVAIPLLYSYTETPYFIETITREKIPVDDLVLFNKQPRSVEFSLGSRLRVCQRNEVKAVLEKNPHSWFYMDNMGRHDLQYDGLKIKREFQWQHHDADRIRLEFLNPENRKGVLQSRYLIQFKSDQESS